MQIGPHYKDQEKAQLPPDRRRCCKHGDEHNTF